MKAMIKGKIYNTETGTKVCSCPRGILYKKYHSIEYFVYDPSRKTITPVTWNEARDISRSNAPKHLHDSLFIPGKDQGRTNVDLSRESYSKLRICAGLHDRPIKAELKDIIDKAYRNRDRHKEL